MKKLTFYSLIFIALFMGIYFALNFFFYGTHPYRQWDVQSIDTMKFSRDRAREVLNGHLTKKEIDKQMKDIASTGATHVSIATPYDEEFIPVMKIWVESARKHGLNVWFRGNLSGWEEWFGYPKIDKETRLAKLQAFIEGNPDLFEDGDIFTSCTECENGSRVEYGNEESINGHRKLLIKEYSIVKASFAVIKKDVKANFYSMNGDIAKAVMDKETTRQLDGIVVVDHYVKDPKQMAKDLRALAKQSGGTIILGELGAPIPDIHGKMTEDQQMLWVEEALHEAARIPQVGGVNYWVNKDGSTALWTMKDEPRKSLDVLKKYFKGKMHVIKYSE